MSTLNTPWLPRMSRVAIVARVARIAVAAPTVRGRLAWCAATAATLAMLACGGANEGGTPAAATPGQPNPPAAQPALAISGFAPASGPAGTVVAVSGTGLDGATAATLGGAAVNFTKVSATQLSITVPNGASSGRVGISAGGRTALSTSDFTVAAAPAPTPVPAAPTVSTVSPTTVIAGSGRLTLVGTALDQVASARLGTVALTLVSQSATSLALDVPLAAASGTLALVDRAGTARNVAQPITVLAALAVTGFTPATLARGQTLTVNGRGLDRATELRFGGGAVAAIASRSGSTALTAVVPGTAISGPVTVAAVAAGGSVASEQAVSSSSLTVLEPIVVTPQTYTVAAVGTAVTVQGTGLAQVNAVSVGNVAAVLTAQAAASLTFTVPAGVSCGALTLRAPGLPEVNAGAVVVGAGCTLRAAAVEFAQVVSQPAGDPYQRLSAGRETWVRAYVVATAAGTPAPAVRAVGTSAAGQALGTLALNGPATLPVLPPTAAITDALRYDDAAAFSAELPAAWVQPGLRVRIEAGPVGAPTVTAEATPLVASSGALRVVLVPLVSGSNVPTMPTVADVMAQLQRKLPVPAGEINVRVRAPYTLTTVTGGVADSAQWSAALSELERLRDSEAPNDLYYGMVRPMVSSGIAGIGYVNSIGSRSPSLASLGWDATRTSWPRTMVHELGHNFSRPHAPCGSVSGADANYPYPNGALGATPLFDVVANDVLAPTGQADIMGYCNGQWFSDYNLLGVMRFLEARPQVLKEEVAAAAMKADNGGRAGEVLVVSGAVDAQGAVTLAPLRTVRADGRPSTEATVAGRYLLRILTTEGATLEHRFEPIALDHAPGEGHFLVRLPHPGGRIDRVEVQREGRTMASRGTTKPSLGAAGAGAGAGAAAAAAGPWAEVQREDDALVLHWGAARWPYASLTLTVGGQRHTLALQASGGRWRIAAEAWRAWPAGGHFEVSLSDGVESTLLVVPRH